MLEDIAIKVTKKDLAKLEAVVADRNSPQKHVWRAQIILLTAVGCGTAAIMRGSGVSKTAVWRWQERFMTEGVAGLLRDRTRPSRIEPLGPEMDARVVQATISTAPPGETTHWTAPAMAKVQGISVSSVQRIWRRHGLQPHRTRHFKLSNDPQFAAKLRDMVGLYVSPPAHAIVDNYATHKHPKVNGWLLAHPWWTFHFTPTSASWLNAVEGFFAKLTKRRLARGVFRSVDELKEAIKRFLAENNQDANPFQWTKKPSQIPATVKKGHQVSESVQ